MGLVDMKEKVAKILGGFLDRNKDYAVDLYINNAVTNRNMGKIFITSDRIYETNDKKLTLKWNKDENYDVRYNDFSIPYDEVMSCYVENDKKEEFLSANKIINRSILQDFQMNIFKVISRLNLV